MLSTHIFSNDPLIKGGNTQFFNLVVANSHDEAQELALDAQKGRIREHLEEQMQEGGVYHDSPSIEHAFGMYYPYELILPINKPAAILLAGNGQAELG